MGQTTTTRVRIVEATSELFRRQGYTGTGVKQIVDTARAPFASLYHFFPGGKEELGAEVIRWSGAIYEQLIDVFFDDTDAHLADAHLPDAMRAFFAGAAVTLRETDYADACPIATVALEVASTNDVLRQATADVFESWTAAATERFSAYGVPPARARELALATIAALEGAFVLCRATRTTEALDVAGETLAAMAASATPKRRARSAAPSSPSSRRRL